MKLLIPMFLFAIAGGWYGWYRRKELVKRGSYAEPHRPRGVSREEHALTLSRWRLRKRLSWVLLYAVCGAMVAAVLMMFIQGAARVIGA
jgi:hypothetical protein